MGKYSPQQMAMTLDGWGPIALWAMTDLEQGWLLALLPVLVAQQMSLGATRVLWTAHAIAAGQVLAVLLVSNATDTSMAAIQIAALYVAHLWLAYGARGLLHWHEEGTRALKVAREALQSARDQASELATARLRAEAANAAKSDFLAHISHELRTPLNAVIGMAELLSHSQLSIEQRDQVATLRQSADTLLALIEDVLDYSKIEANQLELERRPFSLRQCLEMSIDLVAVRAAQKDLDLAYFIDVDVPETLLGDSLRLRQVLTNLLMNAVKFTESGGVGVLVSTDQSPDDSQALHVFVNDTGIGIPAHKVERLFKAFSQVDSSTTRQYGGTGLGLVICKRLVERMGGDIWVDSNEGEGSTFHFTIKLDVPDGVAPSNKETTWLQGKTVLIVDDGVDVSHLLSKHVRSWGGTPLLAASLLELAEWLGLGLRADLALVDLQMPEATGVLDALGKARMPHIAMTWRGQTRLAGRGELAIAFKPVKHDPLAEAVQRAVSPEPATPKRVNEPKPAVMNIGDRVRVMIVDDNVVNQKVGLGMLKRLGLAAHAANNGLEAVEMTRKHAYDLVLMDVFMPVMDGLVATQHIVSERGDKPFPRVVAMTANALETDRQRCLAVGMDDFLTKPLRIDALDAVVKRILFDDDAPQVAQQLPLPPAPPPDNMLDPQTIANLRELDRSAGGGVFDEVVNAYLTDTEERLRELRSALEAQQAALAERLAHTVKGSSGYLGASRIATLSSELEGLVQRGDFGSASRTLEELDHTWIETRPQLQALLHEGETLGPASP